MDAGRLPVSVMETWHAGLPCVFRAGVCGGAGGSRSCIFKGANVKAAVL